MTVTETGTHGAPAVQVRAAGDVDREARAYVRAKVDAALGRPGLPPVDGEVRIARAAAHHAELPWTAEAEIRLGNTLVVVHAREASARELADRLHDRLRGQVRRVLHRNTHRSAPPPWRGGAVKDR
ncbi:hypothetical protein IM697_28290 [Streptomyces ferrugineus]|uniref:Ribosomal subunit interface protein n=1 Tax=Streptomyces ferrugineus TaxID=1413221 RepID=A0A7M2SCK5_9ACTN|nr:hypothetical protein [Streptomyces ferrugineus]QOV34054.1 hypothetical protein IM697_28290 [Streptomyces ferrugineus]